MKFVLFLSLVFASTAFAEVKVSRLRGHEELTERLTERMMVKGEKFSFFPYLQGLDGNTSFSLLDLTGTRPPSGGDFQNGNPNSVNMLIQKLLMFRLSKDIAAGCNITKAKWNYAFRYAIGAMCEWPSASAKDVKVMQAYWIALMGYNAPYSEFQAWKDFFLTSSYANRSAEETVAAMSYSILFNPYFLIKH